MHHVDAIAQRHLEDARSSVTRENFEAIRHAAFPSLTWGQDVTQQIGVFPSEYLRLAFVRLASLDDVVRRWQTIRGPIPDTGNLIFRNESELTMANYGNERRFRSANGDMLVFEKHVWIDRGNRIHFVVDYVQQSLEIGYIGRHLSTWTG